MKRLCFGWHIDVTRHSLSTPLPLALGVPPSNSDRPEDMRRSFSLTSNKGYLVIGEATARLFDCDPDASTMLDLRRFAELPESPKALARRLNSQFDAVVLGLAYEINATSRYGRLVDLLEHLTIPIVTLDLSVADVAVSPAGMHESVMRLARVLSERSALFGVRAFSTQEWLERHGINRAIPVGCPSMYLYPQALMSMSRPSIAVGKTLFATGGYLFGTASRALDISKLFEKNKANYILQDEIFLLSSEQFGTLRYMDWRREFSADRVNDLAEQKLGRRPPFKRYFFFDDMHAWRQCLSWHDIYIGDRFHGAVVAMQAGIPSVVICRDVRSLEIAEYYNLPAVSLDEALSFGIEKIVEEKLSQSAVDRMKSKYGQRLAAFRREIEKCGLRLNVTLE